MAKLNWSKELGLSISLSESETRTIQMRIAQMSKVPGITSADQDAVAEAYFRLNFSKISERAADALLGFQDSEWMPVTSLPAKQERLFESALEEFITDDQTANDWLSDEFGSEDGDFDNRMSSPSKNRGSICQLVVRTPVGRTEKGRLIFKKSFVHGGMTPPLGRILNRDDRCLTHGHHPKVGNLECGEMHKIVYLCPQIIAGPKTSTGSGDVAGGISAQQQIWIVGLSEHWTTIQCKGWPDQLQVDEQIVDGKKAPVLASFADWCHNWTELQFHGRIHGDEEGELARMVGSIPDSPLCRHWSFVESKRQERFIPPSVFIPEFHRAFSGGMGKKYIPGLDGKITLAQIQMRWDRMVAERCCKIAGIPFDRQLALAHERLGKPIQLAPADVLLRHRSQAVKELLTGTIRGDRLQSSSQKSSTQNATFASHQKSGRGKDAKRRTPVDEIGKSTKVNGARMFTWPEGAVLAQMKIVIRSDERIAGLEELLSKNGVSFRFVERKEVCRDLAELEALKKSRYVIEDVLDRKFGQELFSALQFNFQAALEKELSLGRIQSGFDQVVNGEFTDIHRDKTLLERGFKSWVERCTDASVKNLLASLYGKSELSPWIKIAGSMFPANVSVEIRIPESRLENRLEIAAGRVEELGLPVTETTLGLALRGQNERLEFMAEMLAD